MFFFSGNREAVDVIWFEFQLISPSVPEIKTLDRQTDGQQSDFIRVPILFIKRYWTLNFHIVIIFKKIIILYIFYIFNALFHTQHITNLNVTGFEPKLLGNRPSTRTN